MSWLSSFLHPGRGYKAAQGELEKGWQQAQDFYNQGQGYLSPYMQQGQDAYGALSSAMGALLDPAALYSQWAEGYEESPAAQQAREFAKQSGLDAASAMGLMGSTPALSALQAGEANITMQDRQNYLQDLMQKYLAGTGIAQGIYGTGAQAGGQAAQQAMGMGGQALGYGQQMGNLAYGQQAAGGNMLGGLIGRGLGMAGNYAMNQWNPFGGR